MTFKGPLQFKSSSNSMIEFCSTCVTPKRVHGIELQAALHSKSFISAIEDGLLHLMWQCLHKRQELYLGGKMILKGLFSC